MIVVITIKKIVSKWEKWDIIEVEVIKSGGGNRPYETRQPANWKGAKSYGKPKDNEKAIGFPVAFLLGVMWDEKINDFWNGFNRTSV